MKRLIKRIQNIAILYTIVILILVCIFFISSKSEKIITENITVYKCTELCKNKVTEMRLTGYIPTGNKTALREDTIPGYTAAVSRNAMYLLGEHIYIEGYGTFYVNDLTAKHISDKFDKPTIDICVGTKQEALAITNNSVKVIRIK